MENDNPSRTLGDYLDVLRRRKVMIITLAVLVPAVAVLLSSFQKPVYEASTEVALQQNDLAAELAGVGGGGSADPARFTQTQARLARSVEIARSAAKSVGPPYAGPQSILRSLKVVPSLDADILEFVARAPTQVGAVAVANGYARAYVGYANGQDSAAVAKALSLIDARLAQLRAAGGAATLQYTDLQDRRQQLKTYDALNTAGAVVTQPAESAAKVSPRPKLAALFGGFIGLILGVGLAFGLEAVRKPLRTPVEVAEEIGLPLLGRIPANRRDGVVAMTDPNGADAEAYRVLCSNLEFAAKLREHQAIVVTSAREGEGKSTVASNLAVTLARRGVNVILVDGDVMQPSLQTRFGLPARLGLTEVAAAPSRMDDALAYIRLDQGSRSEEEAQPVRLLSGTQTRAREESGGAAQRKNKGQLQVMVTKALASDAAATLLGETWERILADLRERANIVIVDAPPLLTSVGMGWAARADALLVVARLSETSRPVIEELGRALARIPTASLGVVVTGTPAWPGYTANYGASPAAPSASRRAARS